MIQIIVFALSLLAAPPPAPPPASAPPPARQDAGPLFAYAGQTLELFTDPHGPRPNAPSEKYWRLHWKQASAEGFEVVLSEAHRGQEVVAAVVPAPPLTFRLALEFDGCGTAHFKGTAAEQPEASIAIVSHQTRTCENEPANYVVAVLRQGGVETKMFLPRGL